MIQELIEEREMASEDERKGLSKLCIWEGSVEMSTFYSYVQGLHHTCGRTCEAAPILKQSLNIINENCVSTKVPVLTVPITRNKISGEPTSLRIYPHRDTILFCFHFSLAYHILMTKNINVQSPYVFPDFQSKMVVNEESTSEQMEINTAKHFNYFAKKAETLAKKYYDCFVMGENNMDVDEETQYCIPSKIRGHTAKKTSVNQLADSLEIQTFVFRAGWMVRNVHSAFDYIFNNKKKDRLSGKVLAGWTHLKDNDLVTAYPPSLESVKTEKTLLDKFCKHLFIEDNYISNKVKTLLTASILHGYKEFVCIVMADPKRRWITQDHPVLGIIKHVRNQLGITDVIFNTWINEIEEDFVVKNMYTLPADRLGSLSGNILCDPRSIVDKLDDMSKTLVSNNEYMSRRDDAIFKMLTHLENMDKSLKLLSRQVITLGENQLKFEKRLNDMEQFFLGRQELIPKPDTAKQIELQDADDDDDNSKEEINGDTLHSVWVHVRNSMKDLDMCKILYHWYDLNVDKVWHQWINAYPKSALNDIDKIERAKDVVNVSRWKKIVICVEEIAKIKIDSPPKQKTGNAYISWKRKTLDISISSFECFLEKMKEVGINIPKKLSIQKVCRMIGNFNKINKGS